MGKSSKSEKIALRDLRLEYGLIHRDDCSAEDNQRYLTMIQNGEKLPAGVRWLVDPDTGEKQNAFCFLKEDELTAEEKREYALLLQLRELRTIKKCVVFFTVLAIIGLCLGVLSALTLLG